MFPLLVCWVACALAAPSDGLARRSSSNSVSPAIWVPIVVVALAILGTVVLCRRRSINKRYPNRRSRAGLTSGSLASESPAVRELTVGQSAARTQSNTRVLSSSAVRELTADELAGTSRNSGGRNSTSGNQTERAATASTTTNTNTTATTPTARSGRTRRARRTPSQISTKSLPAYNKDPGEEELVIYSGPAGEDEDEGAETTNNSMAGVMSTIAEQTGPHSLDNAGQSRISLLHQQADEDTSAQGEEVTNSNLRNRFSYDTMVTSDESSSALLNDPRGEAPPYDTIDLGEVQHESSRFAPAPSDRYRRSGFLRFFMPRGHSNVDADLLQVSDRNNSGHNRDGSGPSFTNLTSVESSSSLRGGRPRRGHRSNNSSISGINLPFRTTSRVRTNISDDNPLTSPSMLSVNSISAPLTHTAMRTEFTYPRSGPTPEQVKFISSRETFGRFGLPYGPDAIAYAASASRIELVPPPGFETLVNNTSNGNGVSNSVTPDLDAEATTNLELPTVTMNDSPQQGGSPPSPTPSSSGASEMADTSVPTTDEPPTTPGKALIGLGAPPPSSFRFDANQSTVPDSTRSASVASSYATFETARETEPQTPVANVQLRLVSASDSVFLEPSHSPEHGTEDFQDDDQAESIRAGVETPKGLPNGAENREEDEDTAENITTTIRHINEVTDNTLPASSSISFSEAPSKKGDYS